MLTGSDRLAARGRVLADQFERARGGLSGRPVHVLLVEDHRLVRHVMARALRGAGLVVIEAETAQRAREVLDGVHVDAAVLDVSLPGEMNGVQLGHWMRYRDPKLPMVFVTGLTDWEMRDAIPDDPLTRFLRKPFGARVIVDLVSSLLSPRHGIGGFQTAND